MIFTGEKVLNASFFNGDQFDFINWLIFLLDLTSSQWNYISNSRQDVFQIQGDCFYTNDDIHFFIMLLKKCHLNGCLCK